MINFNDMFNNKQIMWLDLIIWLSKFNTVLVLTTSWTTDPGSLFFHLFFILFEQSIDEIFK
jgi:hypothetical protein